MKTLTAPYFTPYLSLRKFFHWSPPPPYLFCWRWRYEFVEGKEMRLKWVVRRIGFSLLTCTCPSANMEVAHVFVYKQKRRPKHSISSFQYRRFHVPYLSVENMRTSFSFGFSMCIRPIVLQKKWYSISAKSPITYKTVSWPFIPRITHFVAWVRCQGALFMSPQQRNR